MKRRDEGKARDILAATLQEIEAVGLAGLSMEAVARRAGVATGTIYIYFKNKEALIGELYLATKRDFMSVALGAEGLPVRAAFSRMCVAYLEYLIEHRAHVIFMTQVVNSPFLSEETRTTAALWGRPIAQLLERGKSELLLKDLEASFMFAFLQAVLIELAGVAAREPKARRAQRFRTDRDALLGRPQALKGRPISTRAGFTALFLFDN